MLGAILTFLIVAGLVSGAVNAVAGGGSLLVFPALLAVGFWPKSVSTAANAALSAPAAVTAHR